MQISSNEMATIENKLIAKDRQIERLSVRQRMERGLGMLVVTGEAVGGAAFMGFVVGKLKQSGHDGMIPGTPIPIELAVGMTLTGVAVAGLFKKYDSHVLNVGTGILAHYAGKLAESFGTTGKFALVAGGEDFSGLYARQLMAGNRVGRMNQLDEVLAGVAA
jgi:hypothetical protein